MRVVRRIRLRTQSSNWPIPGLALAIMLGHGFFEGVLAQNFVELDAKLVDVERQYGIGKKVKRSKPSKREITVRKKERRPNARDVDQQNREALRLHKGGETVAALGAAMAALATAERVFGGKHPKLSAYLTNVGFLMRETGDIAGAEQHYLRNVEIHDKGRSDDRGDQDFSDLSGAQIALGQFYAKISRFAEAEAALVKSIDLLDPDSGPGTVWLLEALDATALFYFEQERLDKAEEAWQRAASIAVENFRRPFGFLLVQRPHLYFENLSEVYQRQNRFEYAEVALRQVLALRDDTPIASSEADPAGYATSCNSLAELLRQLRRCREAAEHRRRALKLRERSLGPVDKVTQNTREWLANDLDFAEDIQAAITEYEMILSHHQEQGGHASPAVGETLSVLSRLNREQGRLDEAIDLANKAINVARKNSDNAALADALENLIAVYGIQNRLNEAEELAMKRLSILESVYGPNSPKLCDGLDSTAEALSNAGHEEAAIALARRGLGLCDTPSEVFIGHVHSLLEALATALRDQGKHEEAVGYRQRALALAERLYGVDSSHVAVTANNLALDYEKLQRFEEAAPLYRRSLDIKEKVLAPDHIEVAAGLHNLAVIWRNMEKFVEAIPLHERAVAIWQQRLGESHVNTRTGLNELARTYYSAGLYHETTSIAERMIMIFSGADRHSLQPPATDRLRRNEDRLFLSRSSSYRFVDAAYQARASGGFEELRALEASFWMSQRVQDTDASGALAQAAARQSRPELQHLLRDRQDTFKKWTDIRENRIKLLSQTKGAPDVESLAKMDAAIVEHAAVLDAVDRKIDTSFPGFFALSEPSPVQLLEAQALLGEDEALVQFLVYKGEVHAWIITNGVAKWEKLAISEKAIDDLVLALRCGLDPASWESDSEACLKLTGGPAPGADTKLLPFRADIAHELYQGLFGKVAGMIAGKDLIIVPSGPLTSLPFQVLVTEKPASVTDYQNVRWLIADHVLTVLPSVPSLAALRRPGSMGRVGGKAYFGMGNPLLTGPSGDNRSAFDHQRCPATAPQLVMAETKGLGAPMGAGTYYRGELADPSSVRGLPPLPKSAEPLCAIARSLGVPESEILLGERATETVLKTMNADGRLGDYKIVHFSTHGLVAGELANLAEPAIVLTPPADDTPLEQLEKDDGLLKASEVTELKLGADWVILSACNTASGDGGNAEALSGLARAFFYAGTRALLVSHWPVFSGANVELTTKTFQAMKDAEASGKPIGRAEALRRSMLALIAKGDVAAHPQVWAPFVLVGEGGVGR